MIAALLLAASATLSVSPVEGTVGDPLEATITVAADGATVEATPLGPDLGDVGVLEGAWQPPSGGTTVWKGRLAAWRVGEITVPPIEVGLARDGTREVVKTEPVKLTIRSVLDPKESKPTIADLKPPATVAPDWRPLRTALVVLAGLLVLAGVAFWIHRRYASRLAAVSAPADPFRRLPPHVWAYEELRLLLERQRARPGGEDLFFEELSRIVKQYLEGRFRVELLERTTAEMAPALSQAGVDDAVARQVRGLLDRADLAKFARAGAGPDGLKQAVEAAYAIVDRTKPAEAA